MAVTLCMAFAGEAEAKKKAHHFSQSSTVAQSGWFGHDQEGPINAQDGPYVFSNASKMSTLKKVTITATLWDGDTGPGEVNENQLTLGLDGIDTGIKLNGFADQRNSTQTISGALDPNVAAQVLTKLKEDGELTASVIPHFTSEGNWYAVPADFDTTLKVEGT
jgi:hypothetical protein